MQSGSMKALSVLHQVIDRTKGRPSLGGGPADVDLGSR